MKRWRQTGIRTLLIATMISASFAAGYRKGNENRSFNDADLEKLMLLIESTGVSESWETLGGPSTMTPYPQHISCTASSGVFPIDDESNEVDSSEVHE